MFVCRLYRVICSRLCEVCQIRLCVTSGYRSQPAIFVAHQYIRPWRSRCISGAKDLMLIWHELQLQESKSHGRHQIGRLYQSVSSYHYNLCVFVTVSIWFFAIQIWLMLKTDASELDAPPPSIFSILIQHKFDIFVDILPQVTSIIVSFDAYSLTILHFKQCKSWLKKQTLSKTSASFSMSIAAQTSSFVQAQPNLSYT